MSAQPEALRLAEALFDTWPNLPPLHSAAAELRRLHALNARCDLELSRVLHELAGAASMCWRPKPSTQEFDSELALKFVEGAIQELRGILRGTAAIAAAKEQA